MRRYAKEIESLCDLNLIDLVQVVMAGSFEHGNEHYYMVYDYGFCNLTIGP